MEIGPIIRALIHNPTRFWLITAEVALTLAIIVNCVAIIAEQRDLLTRPSGLDEANMVVVTTQPFSSDFDDPAFLDNIRAEDLRRLRALPGVRAAAAIDFLPLAGGGSITSLRITDSEGDDQMAPYFVAGFGALDALGVELIAGHRGTREPDCDPGPCRSLFSRRRRPRQTAAGCRHRRSLRHHRRDHREDAQRVAAIDNR